MLLVGVETPLELVVAAIQDWEAGPYQSKSPKYALLIFGPEARTRIWLVLDGTTLYVDRNGNGDLTDAGLCKTKKACYQVYRGRGINIPLITRLFSG